MTQTRRPSSNPTNRMTGWLRLAGSLSGSSQRHCPIWMRGMGLLVLMSWLSVWAMAVAPVLHEHAHAASHEHSHTCLVTQYADGLLNSESPVVFLPLPALFEAPVELAEPRTPVLSSPPKVFSERGPPFLG